MKSAQRQLLQRLGSCQEQHANVTAGLSLPHQPHPTLSHRWTDLMAGVNLLELTMETWIHQL